MKSYCKRKDEVSNIKHMAFLLAWINKFLSYNQSKKVTKTYPGVVVTLAISTDFSLGSFALNQIYKEMNDLTTFDKRKISRTTRGLI